MNSYVDTLEWLDDLSETQSETVRVGVGQVRPECASFVVTYRVPEIELSKSLTNSIWLLGDVPGRTVTTSIRTDCLVSEWYELPGKARDKSDPSTLLIRLAPKRLMTEFPEDARVHTDLGSFRFEFLGDRDKATAMRLTMYEEARELALGEYRSFRTAEGAGFVEEMRDEFQTLHPGKSVRVDRDSSGLVIGINGYFSSAVEPTPRPDDDLALLNQELAKGAAANPEVAWLLSRHAMVAGLGLTACHLRQKNLPLAAKTLRQGMKSMRLHASAVFKRTVGAGSSPTRYLMPAMREHGVTLESMAELDRQAGLAGVLEETQRKTASEFFEELRGSLANARDPKFRTSATVRKLRGDLAEATAELFR